MEIGATCKSQWIHFDQLFTNIVIGKSSVSILNTFIVSLSLEIHVDNPKENNESPCGVYELYILLI